MRTIITITFVSALVALAGITIGCQSPGQPGCMPGASDATEKAAGTQAAVGGIRGESKPETGRDYGAPAATSTYGRGNVTVTPTYSKEARQAGAITNPKAWTADMRLISSAPMSVKYLGQLLEVYAVALAQAKEPEERAAIRADMAALVERAEVHQKEWIGAIAALAPSFDRCVLIQIDGSGSSTGAQPAVNPDNVAGMSEGVSKTLLGAEKIINGEFATEEPEGPDPAPSVPIDGGP